jgi:hypothetical protein
MRVVAVALHLLPGPQEPVELVVVGTVILRHRARLIPVGVVEEMVGLVVLESSSSNINTHSQPQWL